MELSVPSTPESLCIVADVAMDVAKGLGFACHTAEELTQAVLEAVGNAIRHGNALDPEKKVAVRFQKEEGQLRVSIEDEGGGFAPQGEARGPGDVLRESGRGLFLMGVYADEVVFRRTRGGGTRVVLVKRGDMASCVAPHRESRG